MPLHSTTSTEFMVPVKLQLQSTQLPCCRLRLRWASDATPKANATDASSTHPETNTTSTHPETTSTCKGWKARRWLR